MQAASDLKQEPVHRLTSEQEVKAYVHPLRMKILGVLAKEARTISQIARGLEVHPANITHHFRILEKAKLLALVEERDIGRTVEKYYRATAMAFEISPPEGAVQNANSKVLSFLKDDLVAAIGSLHGDDREEVIGLIKQTKISRSDFKVFCERLQGLIGEFERAGASEGIGYTLNLSLYPNQVDYGPLKRIEIRKSKRSVVQIRKSEKKK